MNFSQAHFGNKIRGETCLFSQGKTPEFTKKGEIHELFVSALFLVWFAGATPDNSGFCKRGLCRHDFMKVCVGAVQVTHAQGQGVSF